MREMFNEEQSNKTPRENHSQQKHETRRRIAINIENVQSVTIYQYGDLPADDPDRRVDDDSIKDESSNS